MVETGEELGPYGPNATYHVDSSLTSNTNVFKVQCLLKFD